MQPRFLTVVLGLALLPACDFTDSLFEWLEGATIVCDDMQAQADECWSGADSEEAESECEKLDWGAAQCSLQTVAPDDGEEEDEPDEGEQGEDEQGEDQQGEDEQGEDDDGCGALEEYADACWDAAQDEEDEARCAEIEAELEDCEDGQGD